MKNDGQTRYSITAYLIKTKEREKYYGDESKENCVKKPEYLGDQKEFIKDFLLHLKEINKNDQYGYMSILNERSINLPNLTGKLLTVRFGRAGQDFLTVKPDGETKEYDRETKIVKYYKNFFFIRSDGFVFMVIFRDGLNSCKTAIYDEMKSFLRGTNVIPETYFISNEEYIESLYDDIKYINLSYNVLYKEAGPDNADDPKIVTKRYSINSIDLRSDHAKTKFGSLLSPFFKNRGDRQMLTSALKDDLGQSLDVDENSMSVLVELNGVKRTIRLEDMVRFYDVDITSRLRFDEKGYPTDESIINEVVEYVSGITVGDFS